MESLSSTQAEEDWPMESHPKIQPINQSINQINQPKCDLFYRAQLKHKQKRIIYRSGLNPKYAKAGLLD